MISTTHPYLFPVCGPQLTIQVINHHTNAISHPYSHSALKWLCWRAPSWHHLIVKAHPKTNDRPCQNLRDCHGVRTLAYWSSLVKLGLTFVGFIPFMLKKLGYPTSNPPPEIAPILQNDQSVLMNNEVQYIEPEEYEFNLVKELKWITKQLKKKRHPKSLFLTFQKAGNQLQEHLTSKCLSCSLSCEQTDS